MERRPKDDRAAAQADDLDARRRKIIDLARGASLEMSAREALATDALNELVAPATTIYISFPSTGTHHELVAAAQRLARAGLTPVPHIAARALVGFTQLNDCLVRLAGEAGVEQALVIAGDAEHPVGSFASSQQLLETGLFEKHGIRRIGIAGYPEGHPRISGHRLDEALKIKWGLARQRGLLLSIVTQFGFEAEPIAAWIGALNAQGIDAPVTVGLAAPASVATLAKFAVRCGVGNSLRSLVGGHAAVARLLVESGPERIIDRLAAAAHDGLHIAGLHFYTFGGVRRASAWLGAIARGDFTFAASGGFRVSR